MNPLLEQALLLRWFGSVSFSTEVYNPEMHEAAEPEVCYEPALGAPLCRECAVGAPLPSCPRQEVP